MVYTFRKYSILLTYCCQTIGYFCGADIDKNNFLTKIVKAEYRSKQV